ncbi:MAG TPA: alpha-amylase family glycosyl hydrolase, partial [Rectinemataceae bacterium]|nr:alpha-amylase family glycosyl hydrolase [Rectinemataceae bacterium]
MRPAELLARATERLGGQAGGDPFFFSRLGERYAVIHRLFRSLYGGTPDFEALLERLEALLLEKYRERPEALKASDRLREAGKRGPRGTGAEGGAEAGPEGGAWYLEPGLAAYQLYLDRFAGDLAGFRERIPYLAELGVGLVHLMPFFKSPPGNNDGGYAVSDYLSVDPRYGSNENLVAAAEALHARGMYLAADLVLNHCADDHPWAVAARAGDPRRRAFFYAYPDRELPDRFEAAMPEVFPETAPGNFTWVPEMRAWVMTVFHDFQWDLNWSNPELFLEMLGVLLGMANLGVDLLRLDAVPYLWKRPGTSCQNLDEAHDIVRLLRACAAVVAPGLAFLAEAIVQPAEIVRYLDTDEAEECQLAYHASLMACLWEALATRKPALLRLSVGGETRLPRDAAWLSYARCHDDIGLGYEDAQIEAAGYSPSLHRRFLLDWYSGAFPGSTARGRLFMENPATGDARISGSCASLCGLEAALAAAPGAGVP